MEKLKFWGSEWHLQDTRVQRGDSSKSFVKFGSLPSPLLCFDVKIFSKLEKSSGDGSYTRKLGT